MFWFVSCYVSVWSRRPQTNLFFAVFLFLFRARWFDVKLSVILSIASCSISALYHRFICKCMSMACCIFSFSMFAIMIASDSCVLNILLSIWPKILMNYLLHSSFSLIFQIWLSCTRICIITERNGCLFEVFWEIQKEKTCRCQGAIPITIFGCTHILCR